VAGPGYHINRSNLLVLESKADMQKRGQASPDDADALALTFAADGEGRARRRRVRRAWGSNGPGAWFQIPASGTFAGIA
jgi:phage terminase large subunit